MAEEQYEDLEWKIEQHILSLDANELVKLADTLELDQEDIEGKIRRFLSKLVRTTIDTKVEQCQSAQEKVEYLQRLPESLQPEPPPLEDRH